MPKPIIYVFAPDLPKPLGGMRMLYRHVDILNANGFEAAIVHCDPRFRIGWFEHSTRICQQPIKFRENDVAVFSEIGGLKISRWARGTRKIIFNQNAYYTFMRYPVRGVVKAPYLDPEVVGTIVVSEDSRQYLKYVFPKHPIHRISYSINPDLYYITGRKKKQICFMPRKNVEDAKQVLNILRFRGLLEGWELAVIEGVSEQKAAELLRESLIFLSFGHPEGFGLPPAEAIASGCIVIGYHGNGGREFLTKDVGFPIEVGDVVGYARTVEKVINRVSSDLESLKKMVRAGPNISVKRTLGRMRLRAFAIPGRES